MPISFCLPEMYNLQVHEASSNKLFTEIAPFLIMHLMQVLAADAKKNHFSSF